MQRRLENEIKEKEEIDWMSVWINLIFEKHLNHNLYKLKAHTYDDIMFQYSCEV